MERLTGRNSDGGAFYKNCFREDTCAGIGCSEKCDHCKHSYNACEKLAVYEDAEEQGLLIRLPCKVGDVLWNVENGDIESFVVEEFRITTYKINRIKIYFENTSGFGLCLFDGTLDEGWYKTLEEAEAALERMGNNGKS